MTNIKKSKTKKNKKHAKKKQKTRTKNSKKGGVDDIYTQQELLFLGVADGNIEVVETLINENWLNENIDVNGTRPEDDYTPLMVAVENNNVDMAEVLLLNGADVNAADDPRGNTSLMLACYQANHFLTHMLLNFHADKSLRNVREQTALSILLSFDPRGIFETNQGNRLLIIDQLADDLIGTGTFEVDSTDNEGYTPLMTILGTHQGSPYIGEVEPIVNTLISYGADITIRNNDGTTAYDIAVHYGHSNRILNKVRPPEQSNILEQPIPIMSPETYDTCEKEVYDPDTGETLDREDAVKDPTGTNCYHRDTAKQKGFNTEEVMKEEDYNQCEKRVYDPITYNPLSIENAVKLEETGYCYDRENFRNFLLRDPRATNPMTRGPISQNWIRSNYPRGIRNSHSITNGGRRKSRKSRKSRKKSKKTKKKSRK
jgi:ankyrin repeat protein